MAGKGGGGSWKVAYADFVTAMMAFFLVMWIGSQDEKTKQSVANYFIDPSGTSKKPKDRGALLDAKTHGAVPSEADVAMGRGRSEPSLDKQRSSETRIVNKWLFADPKRDEYWRQQAARKRQEAEQSKEVRDGVKSGHDQAAFLLGLQMRDELTKGAGDKSSELHREMLAHSLNGVNWTQVAEDVLGQ